MNMIEKTSKIFATPHQPFPAFLTSVPSSIQPSRGVMDLEEYVPSSLSIDASLSRPIQLPPPLSNSPSLPLVLHLPHRSAHQSPTQTPSTQSTPCTSESPSNFQVEPVVAELQVPVYTALPTASGTIEQDLTRPTKCR
ncbi:hypothetical protein L208DRAFT_1412732 [Tricholoma matsutake]|nr:hypothetical protein L208DRAFT_1412732 [Tricholoma matsutake 945]